MTLVIAPTDYREQSTATQSCPFDDPALLQDKNPIADGVDHAKVMGNEQIRDAHPRLQIPTEDPKSMPGSEAICDQSIDRDAKCSARNGACFSTRKCCIVAAYSGVQLASFSRGVSSNRRNRWLRQPTCTRTACFGYGYVNPVQEPHPSKIKDLNAQVQIAKAYPATNMAEKTVC
ncbi:hypothetical protein [Sinorhizobium fredii]|uniref:hypothetical protein n=1 Tax=Rhizobium fredii TaxID=380 RepID=UPI00130470E3|nr:hypothetical protein [Sinorhizobium fredii]